MNILLVDDNSDLCRVLEKHFVHRGHSVDIAQDGQKGLRMALRDNYDVILLDVMMPQMNGYKVLEHLRAEGRKTPVLLITAKQEDSDFIKGLELGADDFIQKPFHMDVLFAKMRALVRRSQPDVYDNSTLHYADLTVNCMKKTLSTSENEMPLTDSECELLNYMIDNSSVIIPTEKLAKEELISVCKEDVVQENMKHLQSMLEELHSKVKLLYIRGVGYKLCF